MNAMSLDLHRITLGALIIALGLLVDDAIIAVEMMVVKMEQGWDRIRAASFAWESTAFPMLTGTLVTAAGFLPIGFANSAVGEYAGGIFWIVAIALVASWFVAVIFTPYIGVKLLPNITVHHNHDPHAVYETRVYRILRSMIQWCVDHRVKVVLATVGVFVLSIVGFGHVQQQFFPLSERPELFLQLRLPEGTAFNVTEKSVKKAEALLKDDKDIATYTAYVGQGSPRFWLGLNPQLPNEAFAEIVIVSKDVEARERIKARIEKAVADGALTEARVRVDRFNFGPPVGFPVQFRVIGPDANKVRDIAYQVRDVMRQNPNVKDAAARLERAVALPEARRRSGPRPRARPDPAGRLAGARHADLGRAGDDHPRRHREGRRGRARRAVRAARPRPRRRPHRHLAQRRCRAAAADRQDRIRP